MCGQQKLYALNFIQIIVCTEFENDLLVLVVQWRESAIWKLHLFGEHLGMVLGLRPGTVQQIPATTQRPYLRIAIFLVLLYGARTGRRAKTKCNSLVTPPSQLRR